MGAASTWPRNRPDGEAASAIALKEPLGLCAEDLRIGQRSGFGRVGEFLVRCGGGQEVGESRCQLMVGDGRLAGACGWPLGLVEVGGSCEQPSQGESKGRLVGEILGPELIIEGAQLGLLGGGEGAARLGGGSEAKTLRPWDGRAPGASASGRGGKAASLIRSLGRLMSIL